MQAVQKILDGAGIRARAAEGLAQHGGPVRRSASITTGPARGTVVSVIGHERPLSHLPRLFLIESLGLVNPSRAGGPPQGGEHGPSRPRAGRQATGPKPAASLTRRARGGRHHPGPGRPTTHTAYRSFPPAGSAQRPGCAGGYGREHRASPVRIARKVPEPRARTRGGHLSRRPDPAVHARTPRCSIVLAVSRRYRRYRGGPATVRLHRGDQSAGDMAARASHYTTGPIGRLNGAVDAASIHLPLPLAAKSRRAAFQAAAPRNAR